MAILKCKICGGDMEISADKTFGTCEYCGSTMTLPKIDDDVRAAAFNRGNHFRRAGEFDKALRVYEKIVEEDPNDAEAHWCCALCRFGIEWVEDPGTMEYLPTCHRVSFDPFTEDVDCKAAIELSDGITKRQYQKDAARIAEVQKGILAASQNEKPFDVFICYKESDEKGNRTVDSTLAQDIYYQLTDEGLRVFFARITLEDKTGSEYEPYIFAALNSAKVMVVVGTKPEHFNAVWVKNEWARFLSIVKRDRKKVILPCYRDMDPYDLPEQLSILQSYDMSKIGFMQDLIRGIKKIAKANEPKANVKETVTVGTSNVNVAPLLKRVFMFLEDGNWKEADAYCEKVLDQDPENAQAYLGKLMAESKARRQDDLVNLPIHTFDNNYKKIMRFGDEELKARINGYIERQQEIYHTKLYNDAKAEMNSAQSESEYESAAEKFEKLKEINFKDSDSLYKQCLDKAEVCHKDAIYDSAKSQMNSAHTEEVYKAAAEIFKKIPGFKDADSLVEHCLDKAEVCRKDSVYEHARGKMQEDSLSGCEEAIKLFQTVYGWRDSDLQMKKCQRRIGEIKSREETKRLELERIAELERVKKENQKKRAKKIAVITIPTVSFIVIFVILLNAVIIPNSKYNDAINLYNDGKYERAISAFEELNGYKDSNYQIQKCKTAISNAEKDIIYYRAVELMNNKKYDEAITTFEELNGYKDSRTQIEKCNTAIKNQEYESAVLLFNSGKYIDAVQAFQKNVDFKDSAEYIDKCNVAIKNQEYESAVLLFNSGKYIDAVQAFQKNVDFKDCAEYIDKCYIKIYGEEKYNNIKSIKIGDVYKFGSYIQNKGWMGVFNEKQEIEWIVLDKNGVSLLLISKYALDCKQYNEKFSLVTWEDCTLRKWLNKTFINDAFSEEEQKLIQTTTVNAESNPSYDTNAGSDTKDKVFLLSIQEVNNYFKEYMALTCDPTPYAIKKVQIVEVCGGLDPLAQIKNMQHI